MVRHRGYTLVELMITVAVIGVIGFVVIGIAVRATGCGGGESAENSARAWAQQMGIEAQSVSCVNMDSDGDGYISCTIAQKANDGTVKPIAIECASLLSPNKGCRSPKAVVRGW